MHDECLREIHDHLGTESRTVFLTLGNNPDGGYSIEELMRATRLTTHRVRMALAELRGATLLHTRGRTRLTTNGRQLWMLLRQQTDRYSR